MLWLVGEILGRMTGREPTGVAARLRGALVSHRGWGRRARIGRNVEIVGDRARVVLGDDVTLFGNAYLNVHGDRGRIEIGSRTHIDQRCVLYGQGGLKIGSRCAIASGVIIYTQSNQYAAEPDRDIIDQPVLYAPVTIGDDVWIGAGAIILPGVEIGDHAVIAAGAVVRAHVEPWSVAAGVPAKKVRDRRTRVSSPSRT